MEQDFLQEEEFLVWYIKRRIQSVGLLWNKRGGAWQGCFLSEKEQRDWVLNRLVQNGELKAIQIEGIDTLFYLRPEDEHFLDQKTPNSIVAFLAPLDNLLWDRDMIKQIFDFDYRWEVYTPQAKRKYGYYVLPVLYGNQLIARFEPKKHVKGEPFTTKNWWWEPNVFISDELLNQIHHAIQKFADYLSVPYLETYIDVINDKGASI